MTRVIELCTRLSLTHITHTHTYCARNKHHQLPFHPPSPKRLNIPTFSSEFQLIRVCTYDSSTHHYMPMAHRPWSCSAYAYGMSDGSFYLSANFFLFFFFILSLQNKIAIKINMQFIYRRQAMSVVGCIKASGMCVCAILPEYEHWINGA